MPLITPVELIVMLDLPDNTQPVDRAQLVCDLVIDDITLIAGALTEPYPAGLKGTALMAAARLYDNPTQLWSETVDTTSATHPGDRTGKGPSVLSPAEVEKVRAALGLGGPQWSFPKPDWHWDSIARSVAD